MEKFFMIGTKSSKYIRAIAYYEHEDPSLATARWVKEMSERPSENVVLEVVEHDREDIKDQIA